MHSAHIFHVTIKHMPVEASAIIAVSEDGTFKDLHEGICYAFEWGGGHLHEFIVGGSIVYDVDDVDAPRNRCEDKVRLKNNLKKEIEYIYDFGDMWCHEVIYLGMEEVDHLGLLEYRGVKPIEDCGGPAGYFDLVAILADPNDPQHEYYVEMYDSVEEATGFSFEELKEMSRTWSGLEGRKRYVGKRKSPIKVEVPPDASMIGGPVIRVKMYIPSNDVFRTVTIPADMTLEHFHKVICITMGWGTDCDHFFKMGSKVVVDESEVMLDSMKMASLVFNIGKRWMVKFRMLKSKGNIMMVDNYGGDPPDDVTIDSGFYIAFRTVFNRREETGFPELDELFRSIVPMDVDEINAELKVFAMNPDGYHRKSELRHDPKLVFPEL